ncbi:MAG TPA: phenylalanine--tRNA ligase subunit beta [Vicinamibacterales bacterium]
MRLLLSWVRDFVDVKASAEEVAETLGLRGFEVASVEPLGGGDAVIDFEVTANRPDCLSVLGFAREIGTAYDLPVRLPSADPKAKLGLAKVESGESDRLNVSLEDAELCPRYAAAVATVSATTTPAWMVSRLQAAGVRPISPFVDVTNYVLMELGHPMHAFDLDKLAEHTLRIRRANAGETITTLDGIDRKLDPEMLVIADANAPQAIAGVMGGRRSEVSEETKVVAFESAYFKPSSVRRTSKVLGLKTEASARFERGADINAPVMALQRAIELMHRIGAGRIVGPLIDRYPQPRADKLLHLRRDRLSRLLGLTVPDADVMRILQALGLRVLPASDGWDVSVPTFRVDLLREVDLIEEVGRHHGFDKLEPAFPVVTMAVPPPDPRVPRDGLVRRVLTSTGLTEAVTFGFIEKETALLFSPAGDQSGIVEVANPLSAKFDAMRPSLVPGLLEAVARNRRHGRRDVGLFEIGSRFTADQGEVKAVAWAWTGNDGQEHWSGSAREIDFFDVKGTTELLCDALGSTVRLTKADVPNLVPGQSASVEANGTRVGYLGQLTPAVVERAGAPRQDKVFVAELDLDRLAGIAAKPEERVRPLPRYPSIVRDLSILVAESLPAEIIRGTIQAAADEAAAPLTTIGFFDRYKGKGVPDGTVSVSVRLTFQAADRTLTDGEIQQAFDKILAALVTQHGATQR